MNKRETSKGGDAIKKSNKGVAYYSKQESRTQPRIGWS